MLEGKGITMLWNLLLWLLQFVIMTQVSLEMVVSNADLLNRSLLFSVLSLEFSYGMNGVHLFVVAVVLTFLG